MSQSNYIRKMNIFQLFTTTVVLAFKNFWPLTVINVITWIPSLFYTLMGLFMGPTLIAASNAILGRPIKVADSFKRGMSPKYLWQFVLVLIPAFIIILLLNDPLFAFFDGIFDFSIYEEGFGDIFTLFLLYFLLFPLYVFFPMAHFLEKLSFRSALKRTFQIIRGNWLRILLVTVLFFVFWPIYNYTLGYQLFLWFGSDLLSVYILVFILVPFISLFYMLMYYEYRARNENYSEEILAQEMGYQPMQEMMTV